MDRIDNPILAEIFKKLDPSDVMTVRAVSRLFRDVAVAKDFRKDGLVASHWIKIWSVAWSPDGHWLAYSCSKSDGTGLVGVWCHKRNTHLRKSLRQGADSVCWSPDSTRIAIRLYGPSKVLILSRDQSGSHLTELKGHEGRIESPAWSRDGTRIACISRDRMLNVWNAGDGQLVQTLDVGVCAACVCWDWSGGEGVTTQGGEGTTDTRGGDRRQSGREPRRWRLAVGCDQSIIVYDSNDGLHWTSVKQLHAPWTANVLAWNPAADGIICAAGIDKYTLTVWDVSSGTEVATIDVGLSTEWWYPGVCWSPCGRRIAATSLDQHQDNFVRVWELPLGRGNVQVTQPMGILALGEQVSGLDWSPDGNWIAISVNHGLRLWAAPR